jgi:hypothetical protein
MFQSEQAFMHGVCDDELYLHNWAQMWHPDSHQEKERVGNSQHEGKGKSKVYH